MYNTVLITPCNDISEARGLIKNNKPLPVLWEGFGVGPDYFVFIARMNYGIAVCD